MAGNNPSRELFQRATPARPSGPHRTLIVRTPRRTYGFRYSGFLDWEGTDSVLVLHFARANVIVHGKDLLKTFAEKLAEDQVAELVEPQRGDRFGVSATGSEGVLKIEVEYLRPQ